MSLSLPVDEALIRRLAGTDDTAHLAADATVEAVRSELESLAAELSGAPPLNPFEQEPACENLLGLVDAIGHEPSRATRAAAEMAACLLETQRQLGQYQLLARLGQGGMGTVYKALHKQLDKVVAVKVLASDRLADPAAVARFQREMRAIGKLEHPQIVRAMDAGDADGTHFLVMELVDGEDAGSLVRRRGPLPVATACEIVRQAAVGLQYATSLGLTHRDIKPSNLMVSRPVQPGGPARGEHSAAHDPGPSAVVKILDLGLARLDDAPVEAAELTAAGQIMGTLDYMSPEQAADPRHVDARADVYSLGATLYKLLTGRAPFDAPDLRSPLRKLAALASQAPAPITTLRPDVPGELAALVHAMLAKLPGERPLTPGAVADRLLPFCRGADLGQLFATDLDEPPVQRSSSHDETATQVDPAEATLASPPERAGGGRTSRKSWLWAGGVAAALLLAAMFSIVTDRGTVVVEVDPALAGLVRVDVLADGDVVSRDWRLQAGANETTVRSGRVQIVLPAELQDQLLLQPDAGKLELRRGESVVFRLKRSGPAGASPDQPPVAATAPIAAPSASNAAPPEAVAQAAAAGPGPQAVSALHLGPHEAQLLSLPKDLMSSDTFTLEFWVRPDREVYPATTFIAQLYAAFVEVPVGAESTELAILYLDDARCVANQFDQDYSSHPTGGDVLAAGRWTHLAAVRENGLSLSFYINGQPMRGVTMESQFLVQPLRAILLGHPNQEFSGDFAEVRFSRGARYTRRFTPEGRLAADEQTAVLFHLDEGRGKLLVEASDVVPPEELMGGQWKSTGNGAPAARNAATSEDGPVAATPQTSAETGPQAPFALHLAAREGQRLSLPEGLSSWDTFTLEFWVRTDREVYPMDTFMAYLSGPGRSPLAISYQYERWVACQFDADYNNYPTSGDELPRGRWTHLAVVRENGLTATFFVNGQPLRGVTMDTPYMAEPLQAIELGGMSWEFSGDFAEVRLSRGARYTRRFTPERRLAADEQTVVLFHLDEGRGKVLVEARDAVPPDELNGGVWTPTR
jgi:serine/threonine protein kinase